MKGWKKSAAMGNAYFQAGIAVQNTAENQLSDRQGGFQRMAEQIDEIVLGKPIALAEARGMDEDQAVQLFNPLKEGTQPFCR